MSREYTPLPHEYLEEMDCLSDAEYGRLVRGLQNYSITGEEPKLSGQEKVYWKRVRNREDRYQESFGEKEKARAERAAKAANARWGNAKNANACASITSNAKNANTKANTDTKANPKAKAKDIFAEFAAEDADLLASLTGFEEMRKKIKSPMTDRAKSMMAKKLTQMSGGDHNLMIALLDQSTMNGWKDIYALKQPIQKASVPDYNAYAEDSL